MLLAGQLSEIITINLFINEISELFPVLTIIMRIRNRPRFSFADQGEGVAFKIREIYGEGGGGGVGIT